MRTWFAYLKERNMSKDFTVTVINPERVASFEAVFGSATVYVKSPIPEYADLPGLGQRRVYKLDMALLTPEQRDRLVAYLSDQFRLGPVEANRLLDERGMPILASDCVVSIANPQKWVD
jgi:hypothetical protein